MHLYFRRGLALCVVPFMLLPSQGLTADRFNPAALEIDAPQAVKVDLSQFSQRDSQAAGVYRVDIEINGETRSSEAVTFARAQNGTLVPQFTLEKWQSLGINTGQIATLLNNQPARVVTEPQREMPEVATAFDFARQRLKISVPQALLNRTAQGEVDPSLWDDGIPALLLNYSLSGARSWMAGNSTDNHFLNLRSGANLTGWRLRNYSTLSYSPPTGDDWRSAYSYLQHDVRSLKGQFITGDTATPADVFDSVSFRGLQLISDDNMLPESLRGFAPTIRGIARSSAQVTVRQQGAVIYQTYVTPGAFAITDLYPASSSGDLMVTVTESNGESHTFSQPFSAVPVMQREGRLKYAFSAGKYRSFRSGARKPYLGQGTAIYGLSNGVTLYGGSQISDHYHALNLGTGAIVGDLGSASLDATWARSQLGTYIEQGLQYRLQYAKTLADPGTTLSAGINLYSGGDYYNFNDASDWRNEDRNDNPAAKKSQYRAELTQTLNDGKWGALALSWYQLRYRGGMNDQQTLSVNYNASIGEVSYGLMISDSRTHDGFNDRQIAFTASMPLGRTIPDTWTSFSASGGPHAPSLYQAGINGTLLKDKNLSYNLSEGYGTRGEGNSGNVNASWLGSAGQLGGGYTYSRQNKQLNYSVQGSLLGHAEGITLGQPLPGDLSALALVKAPGAAGVKINNSTGLYTDPRGYAVVRYLNAYRRTRVALDTTSLPGNVDIDSNVLSVVPGAGAVVLAPFDTRTGGRLLITLHYHGGLLPFGAMVNLERQTGVSGIVDENGQVYLSGLPLEGVLHVRWEGGACQARYAVPPQDLQRVTQASAQCQ